MGSWGYNFSGVSYLVISLLIPGRGPVCRVAKAQISMILVIQLYLVSFAFFCCHLRYAGFGHINQKPAPYCSRGSSRKQFSGFFYVEASRKCLLQEFVLNLLSRKQKCRSRKLRGRACGRVAIRPFKI